MLLQTVDTVDLINPEVFRQDYYLASKPLVIKHLSRNWPAFQKWSWEYFKEIVGDKEVGIYNNIKTDAFTPVNTPNGHTTFGEYVDMISQGPAGWRIFLFNIFDHAPQLTKDFEWPDHLAKGFVKRFPMLFVGGATSITHMHFDIDLSHVFHTQFMGRKRVLLFPYSEQKKLYRKPFEVQSQVDFSHYHDNSGNPDYDRFPALRYARGYEVTLEHGDTLFMPSGYWHHMEYLDSGFAMSLRSLQTSVVGKARGLWNLVGMRNIDTFMKKNFPEAWYSYKIKKLYKTAAGELKTLEK